uniref:Protein RRP5 n=1 Tax=Lygus hesperus TaxID=30085 RepID=A0A146M6Y7_LYGHE
MTVLKTNPLLTFPEYDQQPEKEGCHSLNNLKKEVKEVRKNNTNPFLTIPEYENESFLVSNNNRRQDLNEPSAGYTHTSSNNSLKRQRLQWSSANPTEEKKFSINCKDLSKKKKKKKKKKEKSKSYKIPKHEEHVNVMQTTWGVPSPVLSTSKTTETTLPDSLSLEAVGGFDWNATSKDLARVVSNATEDDSETEDSDGEIPVKRKKLTPSEKRERALQEEKVMKKKEKELLEAEENPQSPDHFERLLIGSPNSAELWIKYMGYHAVNADIEKARAVARRGIKRIDPQLTSAKQDIWIALLNLEHTFSPPETFKETFSEALKCNDDFAINTRVLSLYADAKNVTEVDQLTNLMTRKYKGNVDNWLQCQNALMSVGLVDKARNLLQKALLVLTKKEHVTLISRFALLENKHGFPEQAQALFENLLTSFPQRLDLLSVYVDLLIKSESINLARSVLERAASNSLPVRKMRSIYLKWIAFEEIHGKPSDVAKVEEAAKKYVTNLLRPHKVENTQQNSSKRGTNDVKKEDGLGDSALIKHEETELSSDEDFNGDEGSEEDTD